MKQRLNSGGQTCKQQQQQQQRNQTTEESGGVLGNSAELSAGGDSWSEETLQEDGDLTASTNMSILSSEQIRH